MPFFCHSFARCHLTDFFFNCNIGGLCRTTQLSPLFWRCHLREFDYYIGGSVKEQNFCPNTSATTDCPEGDNIVVVVGGNPNANAITMRSSSSSLIPCSAGQKGVTLNGLSTTTYYYIPILCTYVQTAAFFLHRKEQWL